MSPLAWQIAAAVVLDLLLGDPGWLPHPVRGIGRLCAFWEKETRQWFGGTRLAGAAAAGGVLGTTLLSAWGLLELASWVHPWLGSAAGTAMIYASLAIQDLVRHSGRVVRALEGGNLPEARKQVGWMVGRDTENLDEAGVARAAVESVAESMVDGIASPLFYAALGGPVAALAFRAVNTLDSVFGYQNEQYREFGWASARLDDLANFVPARLAGPLICLAAGLAGMRAREAWRILRRDKGNHPSPNSGRAEAAVAGALGVRLGGLNYYGGAPSVKPYIGDPAAPMNAEQILCANRLVYFSSALFLALSLILVRLLR